MLATMQRTTTGPRFRGSRFFAARIWRRAPRWKNARPAKRVAGQKTAPRKIFSAAPKTRRENASQTLGTHQKNSVFAYDFASGCAVGPNSEVTFWGEFGKEAREFGPRTADRISEGAKQAALWALDVVNAGAQVLYGEPAGSEQRWKPQSVYTTDASITSKQILISTADAATFGIPAGTYKIVRGDYRGAQDSFGGGALVLISADLAGVRSPTIEFTSPRANLLVIRGLDVVSDGTVLGRLPDPRTAQAPMDPPAITLTIGSKPTAGAGGRGK